MSGNNHGEEAIFESALNLQSPAERETFLRAACGEDDAMRQRLLGLVQAHERAGRFLEGEQAQRDALASAVKAVADADHVSAEPFVPLTEQAGDRIGRYKLLEPLGEGGFGVVWMAEQEEPVRRRVALKVIRLGMDTREVLARFEAERQALALMDHPNIARVLDGGASHEGRPFFVMELVPGLPITRYCDEHQVAITVRLELFIQVCQAVQHAHQKGVVHRDLKPSNILVTEQDGRPVPKVIDFGVAKAIEGRLTDKTLFTQIHQLIGTPSYMSPEQAGLGNLDIDTRSDIYSLGILLYELLTGTTPFDAGELARLGLDEMRRTIREREPVRPSARLRALPPPTQHAVAQQRQTEPPKLLDLLHGDLDWIVMKCLEKDRARRYATVNGLAADVQRHLNYEPVVARPPSRLYRFRKMARRNWLALAAVNAVAATLAVGLGVSLWLFSREREAHDKAHAAEQKAQDRLRDAYVAQARAHRYRSQAGRRFDGMEALAMAAAPPRGSNSPSSLELRNEAIALLAIPDVRIGKQLPLTPGGRAVGAVEPSYARYALTDVSGNVTVHRFADGHLLASLPGFGFPVASLAFSPDGKYLAAKYDDRKNPGAHVVQVWELAALRPVLALTNVLARVGVAFTFHPQSSRFAVGRADGTIELYDLPSGRLTRRLAAQTAPYCLRFSPDGSSLAVSSGGQRSVMLVAVAEGTSSRTLSHPAGVFGTAWHPAGAMLAAAGDDGQVYLWDMPQGRLRSVLTGHQAQVVHVAFSPDGELLASVGWDAAICLWNPFSKDLLVRAPGKLVQLQFDPSGHWLGLIVRGNALGVQELAAGHVCRPVNWEANTNVHGAAFSPDGRYLALATDNGVALWEKVQRRQAGRLDFPAVDGMARFTTDGRSLVASGQSSLQCWPLLPNAREQGELQFGRPLALGLPKDTPRFALLARTRQLASAHSGGWTLVDLDRPAQRRHVSGHPQARFLSTSPDGKWIATGAWHGTDVVIWDTASGRKDRTLSVPGSANVLFSPDGRWLVTACNGHFQVWETGEWRLRHQFTNDPGVGSYEMAFSPGTGLLAIRKSATEVQLLDPADGRELAVLPGDTVWPLCFSPDGELLVVAESQTRVRIWDLRLLREELAKLSLDWELPPYPPAREASSTSPLRTERVTE